MGRIWYDSKQNRVYIQAERLKTMAFYICFILIGLFFAVLSLFFPSLRWQTRQANKSKRNAGKTKRRTEEAKRNADALAELRKTQSR